MKRKPKFKPEICRVKLNQEQAVLSCVCYDQGFQENLVSNSNRSSSTYRGCGLNTDGISKYVAWINECLAGGGDYPGQKSSGTQSTS